MRPPDLWRTTTFRLTLLLGGVFAAGIVALLSLIYWSTATYLVGVMDEIVIGQARGLEGVAPENLPAIIKADESEDVRGVYYYGLFGTNGAWIAGNVRRLPPSMIVDGRPRELKEKGFQRGARALAERLPWGETLFVGFDAKTLAEVRRILEKSLIVSGALIFLLGIGVSAAVSLDPLRRVRDIQKSSEPILAGDVSARLPISSRQDELDMLASISNRMMDEVERLLWQVKSVGDHVAHDLRTPLNRLRALLYRMRQDRAEDDADVGPLDQALHETDTLLARFKAIQRIGEIDRRERRAGFGAVRLDELIEELGSFYEPIAEDRGVELRLRIEETREVLADRGLLFEAVGNLVANAIKFTPSGGAIELALSCAGHGPAIEVIDNGPGVPVEERQAVFERFYRGRGALATPGSGLGLSIVAAIARLHDFRLRLADANPGLQATLECWPASG